MRNAYVPDSRTYPTLAVIAGLYLLALSVSFGNRLQAFAPTSLFGVALVLGVITHLFNVYQVVHLSKVYKSLTVVIDLLLVCALGIAINLMAHPTSGNFWPNQQELTDRILGRDPVDLLSTFHAFFGLVIVIFLLLIAWHLSAIKLYREKAALHPKSWPFYIIGWIVGLSLSVIGIFGILDDYELLRWAAVVSAASPGVFVLLTIAFGQTYEPVAEAGAGHSD